MKYARWGVIVFFFVLIGVYFITLSYLQHQHPLNRDNLRQQHISEIMSVLENHLIGSKFVLPPEITYELRQIGQGSAGCSLSTQSCQITNEVCVNLNEITGNTSVSLPSDILAGTLERTHFAIKRRGPENIAIVACDAEGNTPILIEKTFPGLHELDVSTMSASILYE